jgi:hypothetical protein
MNKKVSDNWSFICCICIITRHSKYKNRYRIDEINNLEYKRNGFRAVLSALQNQISAAKDSLKFFQSLLGQKIQNIAETDKKISTVREYQE